MLADASAAFSTALNLDPEYWDALIGLARVSQHQGMKNVAQEKVKYALFRSPRHPDALVLLGNIAAADGKNLDAIEHYAISIAQEPNHKEALYGIGNCLTKVGNFDDAIKAYNRCLYGKNYSSDNELFQLKADYDPKSRQEEIYLLDYKGFKAEMVRMGRINRVEVSNFGFLAAYSLGALLESFGDKSKSRTSNS